MRTITLVKKILRRNTCNLKKIKYSYPLVISTNEINSNYSPEKQRKFGSFRVSRLESRTRWMRKKKKGKEKEEKYRARASVCGHANVVQRDTYVRTPFINNVTWWYIDLKPRCYAGSEERVWSRTM